MEVIGVAADARNRGPRSAVDPELFTPVGQDGGMWNQLFLVVRTDGDPRAMLPTIRTAIAELDADQPVYAIQTLNEALAATLFQQRAAMTLMALFAGVALVLAIVGVYGVLSYLAAARTTEVGLRIALGARQSAVVGLLLEQAFVVVVFGVLLGLAGAVGLGRFTASLLFGVAPYDPPTLTAVLGVMTIVGMVAAYLPARRASRLDPARVLRDQ